jgi:signal transduction histidine kinase
LGVLQAIALSQAPPPSQGEAPCDPAQMAALSVPTQAPPQPQTACPPPPQIAALSVPTQAPPPPQPQTAAANDAQLVDTQPPWHAAAAPNEAPPAVPAPAACTTSTPRRASPPSPASGVSSIVICAPGAISAPSSRSTPTGSAISLARYPSSVHAWADALAQARRIDGAVTSMLGTFPFSDPATGPLPRSAYAGKANVPQSDGAVQPANRVVFCRSPWAPQSPPSGPTITRMDSAEALSDAVLAIAAEHAVEPVLQKLVDAARELAGARYAAIGVPDGEGGFSRFITSGMSDELIAALGPLPRTHGLLGAMLEPDAAAQRTTDIREDPRFRGWWPDAHPSMSSFLGVPIVARGHVAGAFYLTDKDAGFSDDDQALIETFAAHAALAIENARLHERSRELSIVEERNRLARELHDAVTQKLFGVVLAAESGAALLDRDVAGAGEQLRLVRELAGEAMDELRSVIVHLRPPALEAEGLAVALGKHVDVLRRAHRREIALDVAGQCPRPIEADVFRIAQEALHNALRHAHADTIAVSVRCDGEVVALTVSDDGVGFDTSAVRSRSLGLTTISERARAIGGDLRIDSAPGSGTAVRLAVRP